MSPFRRTLPPPLSDAANTVAEEDIQSYINENILVLLCRDDTGDRPRGRQTATR